MRPFNKQDIDPKYLPILKVQDYSGSKRIDGVMITELKTMVATDGYFLEIGRFTELGILDNFPDFHLKQISLSVVEPGGIKGWHVHFNQEDIWFVPPDSSIMVGLHDLRKDSPTAGVEMKFVAGNHKSQLLYIPRGVAHGVANISTKPATMLYLLNQQFDIKDPDERRLPVDVFGKDFWEMPKG